MLKPSKQPANGFVFFWDSHLKEFTTVLKNLDVSEFFRQESQDAEPVGLSSKELK